MMLAAVLAGALSALTIALALAAPRRSFLHMATDLSRSPTRASSFADLAISPDKDRVVVVWAESYQDWGSARGPVLLRWASESTGSGWSDPVTISAGSADKCAIRAAVAVTGTTAHVVYVAWIPCTDPSVQAIYYRTYQLGGGLGAQWLVTSALVGTDPGFTDVDIALDDGGGPHLLYTYFARGEAGDVGTVYYARQKEDGSFAEEQVSADGQNASSPAIAWSDGYVHATWIAEEGGWYRVYYRRRTTGSAGIWGEQKLLLSQGNASRPYESEVEAYSRTVFVVWDMGHYCQLIGGELQCDAFTLGYVRSTTSGATWPEEKPGDLLWCEVGGGLRKADRPYSSTNSKEIWEYGQYLRPSVALDERGWPTVAWHVNQGSESSPDYDIFYAYALSVSMDAGECISWSNVLSLTQNTGGQSGGPVVAVAAGPPARRHFAYVWSSTRSPTRSTDDWETFYDGNEYDQYPHLFLPVVMRNATGGGGGGGEEG